MIRNFQPSDYETISSWWESANEKTPPIQHMPEYTTFVYLNNNSPVASLGYFATNTDIALVQNFIASPDLPKQERKEVSTELSNYVDSHAKSLGFNILLGMTKHPKLAKRYEELGYKALAAIYVAKEI